jgi:sulfide:quinone oxidoreductase
VARALVLGAGFGGISAALELRRLLDRKHDVVLVDDAASFRMGLGNLWLLDGRRKMGEGARPLALLEAKGIQVRRGRIDSIDVAKRSAVIDGKETVSDGIVIALGTRLAPEATPGFPMMHNLYEESGAAAFGEALRTFRGGRVLIQVCALPFRCPPAPYEAAMLSASVLRRRGVTAEVHLATPEPHPLPVAPPEVGGGLLPLLEAAGITYHPGCKPTKFEGGTVTWEAGGMQGFDLVAAVPVHQVPAVIAGTGLAGPSGFIPVDPMTLRTRVAGVYAVGDVAAVPLPNGKMIPKAGILAEGQGRVAAAHLANEIMGGSSEARFEGKGTCFIEVGGGEAIPAEGDFFAAPQPAFVFGAQSKTGLRDKERFESERLRSWFG